MTRATSYPSWRTTRLVSRIFQYLVLSVVILFVLVPVLMLVFGGLKTRGELLTHPYSPPIPPRWENMASILAQPIFWQMLRNSTLVMIVTTIAVVVLCSLAAFVFARMQFRTKGLAFNLFTLGLMFPVNIAILPVYFVLRQVDLLIPLIVLNSEELWTLPLGTMQFQGQYGSDLALVSAFITLSAIPTIIFYIFAERQIVSGLTAGA